MTMLPDNIYKTAFDIADEAFFLVKQKLIVDCNQAALKMLDGRSKDTVINQDFLRTILDGQPNYTQALISWKKKFQTGQNSAPFEWTHHVRSMADAPATPVQSWVTVKLITVEDDLYLISFQAIKLSSEQEQRNRELQRNSNRFNLLNQVTQEGLWEFRLYGTGSVTDPNNEVWWSPQFLKLIGHDDASEFPHRIESWVSILHPDDRGALGVFSSHADDYSGNTPYDIEYRLLTKSGEYRWFRAVSNTLRDEEGVPLHIVGLIEDITERREVEATQRRLSNIIEATSDFVMLIDPQGKFHYLNPAARRLIGVESEGDLGPLNIRDFMPPSTRTLFFEEIMPNINQYNIWSGEAAILTGTGQEIPTLQVVITQRAVNGEIEFYSLMIRDISELKAAEAEQKRLLSELQETYRQYVQQEWDNFLTARPNLSVEYLNANKNGAADGGSAVIDPVSPSDTNQLEVTVTQNNQETVISVPLSFRGQVIGTLSLQDDNPNRAWSADDTALVQAVCEQLALTLDNLRLIDNTQRNAWRDKVISESTAKVWATTEIEDVMRAAVTQLGQTFKASEVSIQIDPDILLEE